MGTNDKGAGKRGFRCPDPGPDIIGSGPVGIVVCVGDVDDDPTHRECVGGIPPQGVP